MRRYRRLIITAIVACILLLVLNLVQAMINRGFAQYLQTNYPEQSFKLSSPVIRLFPLRYELKVYDAQNQVEFLTKAVFSLRKAAANKAEKQEKPAEQAVESASAFLSFERVYSDNYLAQKQAKLVYEQLHELLNSSDYRQLIERYSIQVNQAVSVAGEPAKAEQARLLVRFRKHIQDQAAMTANISRLVKDLQAAKIAALGAIYCESSVLARTEESFKQLNIPAQTWQKTRNVTSSQAKESTNGQSLATEALATEVVASGYQYDYFCYSFNYNLAFAPISEALIQNGLRIQELGGESLERFQRPWHYNYNV